MAKRLVLDALQGVLSDYLEIDETNFDLNLAVWSGSIIMHDVKLKTDKLFRNFNTTFVYGSVKTLEVFIPWTALLNSPVRINIDGVYLQLCPLNMAALDKEETRKRIKSQKQEKIAFADKFLTFHHHHDNESDSESDADSDSNSDSDSDHEHTNSKKKKEKKKSWLESWSSKIVDNLEINLMNIHARYEDTQHGHTYSAGMTLKSFVLATCDENWQSTFVARIDEAIRKMVKVENFGVYWNMHSESLGALPFEKWQEAMHGIIYQGNNDGSVETSSEFLEKQAKYAASKGADSYSPKAMKFILAPTNQLVVKVIHNEMEALGDAPKYDVTVVNEHVSLALDGLQYKQLNLTLEMIGAVERRRQPYMYKPLTRPVDKASARAWWKYGVKLAIKRPRYIHLVKMSKTANSKDPMKDCLSDRDRDEMDELEERLPLHTIVIFRHMAADEMDVEAQARKELMRQARQKEKKGASAVTSFVPGQGAVVQVRS